MPIDDLDHQFSPETLTELGKLSIRMSRNPKTRRPLLKMIQAHDPSYQLPGDQQVQDLREEMASREHTAKLQSEFRAVQERLSEQRAGLLSGSLVNQKFDEVQVKDIEAAMQKYGVSDYEAGAKIYLADKKPERPQAARSAGASWTFPDLPGLMEDPAGAARNAAYSIIDEMRR